MSNRVSIGPIIFYCVSVIFCLGFSTIYHIWSPYSKKINKFLQRLDMGGICVLIFGSSLASNYYFFYCRPLWKNLFTGISLFTNLMGFLATMIPHMHKREYNWIKGVLFSIIGVFNGSTQFLAFYFPLFQNRSDDIPVGIAHFGVVFMGVLYLIGATFYVKKFPEKYYSRKFEIWLNSHTIFHIFVFLAAVEYYFVMMMLYRARIQLQCVAW